MAAKRRKKAQEKLEVPIFAPLAPLCGQLIFQISLASVMNDLSSNAGTKMGSAIAPAHPLDPLGPEEIRAAVALVRQSGKVSDRTTRKQHIQGKR